MSRLTVEYIAHADKIVPIVRLTIKNRDSSAVLDLTPDRWNRVKAEIDGWLADPKLAGASFAVEAI